MGAADLIALSIVTVGGAVVCIVIGRLLDRVERVVKLLEQYDDETREGFRRVHDRIDATQQQIGAIRVIDGGRVGPR